MAETPPVVGAALPVHWIAPYRDWLFEKDRDLELQGFHEAAVLEGDWQALAAQAKKELDGFRGRLGLHGPFWGFTVASEDPAVREIVTRRLMQGLDACAAVGAVQMVIHSPYTTWDHNNLDNRPDSRDAVIGHARATLAPVLTRAEDQGVQLVMENIADVDPAERRRLVEALGSPALALSIDTGHAHYAHCSTGAPPVDYFVKSAGERLAHMHLQDADGYADRHWAIGEGTIRWAGVFRALAALETKPHLVLELHDKRGIPASMAWLEAAGLAV